MAAGSVAGSVNKKGYRIIFLGRKGYKAHRLAWLLMYGTWPADTINHKNGQKDDNRISNLENMARSDNSKHAHQTGLIDNAGEANASAKLTAAQVREIRNSVSGSRRDLARRFGVCVRSIANIQSGKSWRTIAMDSGE